MVQIHEAISPYVPEVIRPHRITAIGIDNDPMMGELLDAMIFGQVESFRAAQSLQDVLDACERGEVNTVFTDYEMPGMNGLELSSRIRDMNPVIDVVLMTGTVGTDRFPSDQQLGKSGIGYVLGKPFGYEDVYVLVGQIGMDKAIRMQKPAPRPPTLSLA